jgi:hypothetical protein
LALTRPKLSMRILEMSTSVVFECASLERVTPAAGDATESAARRTAE